MSVVCKHSSENMDALSFPIVIFATIFFNTVFLFWNFLSFASAACSSARNSYATFGIHEWGASSVGGSTRTWIFPR